MRDELERRREVIRAALNMMRSRLLKLTYDSWATVVGEEERRQAVMRPFANMMMNRLLTVTFNAWRDQVAHDVNLRVRYAAKIAKTLLAKCYLAWLEEAQKIERGRAREAEARQGGGDAHANEERRAVLSSMGKVREGGTRCNGERPTALAGKLAARAFDKWHDFADERRRFQELGHKMVARYRNQLLAKFYLVWLDFVREEKEERQREAEEEEKRKLKAMALMSKVKRSSSCRSSLRRGPRRRERRSSAAQSSRPRWHARCNNQILTKCFLAWAAEAATEAAKRHHQLETALAFLSGRSGVPLALLGRLHQRSQGGA